MVESTVPRRNATGRWCISPVTGYLGYKNRLFLANHQEEPWILSSLPSSVRQLLKLEIQTTLFVNSCLTAFRNTTAATTSLQWSKVLLLST